MKLSESNYNFFVLFLNKEMVLEHSIGYVTLPDIGSLRENFEELYEDDSLNHIENISELNVIIVSKEDYIKQIGDIDLEGCEEHCHERF